MRDQNRIDTILETISKYWKTVPDWRLGQLISNIIDTDKLYYIEDDELIKLLEEYFNNN